MSGSAARRVGGVDERRRQATLLHPFVNGVRAFGSAWLSSLPRRSPVARGGQACGSRRCCTGSVVSLPTLPWRQRKNRGGREKEEREGRRVNRNLTQNDSNFCIETRKTVNIIVVGNSKIYNFVLGKISFELWFKNYFEFPKTVIRMTYHFMCKILFSPLDSN